MMIQLFWYKQNQLFYVLNVPKGGGSREGGKEGERVKMFGTSRTFSLCSECSKARAVKEMF
jgi:hypothetical protein